MQYEISLSIATLWMEFPHVAFFPPMLEAALMKSPFLNVLLECPRRVKWSTDAPPPVSSRTASINVSWILQVNCYPIISHAIVNITQLYSYWLNTLPSTTNKYFTVHNVSPAPVSSEPRIGIKRRLNTDGGHRRQHFKIQINGWEEKMAASLH